MTRRAEVVVTSFGHSRGLRRLLAVVSLSAVSSLVIGLHDDLGWVRTLATLLTTALFVIAGAVAARRRPANPTGLLMVVVGVLSALGVLIAETQLPWRYTLGLAASGVGLPVFAWLVVAFPTGWLGTAWPRLLVGTFFLVSWGTKPFELAWSTPASPCLDCPPAGNVLFTGPAPIDLGVWLDRRDAVSTGLILLVLGTLAVRFARASPPLRRVIAPVLLTSGALTAKLALDELFLVDRFVFWLGETDSWLFIPQSVLAMLVPLAFLAGLLRTRVTRSGVGELIVDLGRMPASGPLRELLARALGDPSLRVGFWAQPLERYVDAAGVPLQLPDDRDHLVTSHIAGERGPLAVLVHDPALLEDEGLIDAVAAAARLALENERLKAEVRAQLAQVSRSRARIQQAADAERQRIERDLHDGAQQHLVALAVGLRLLRGKLHPGADLDAVGALVDRAGEQTRAALRELRDLARGVYPPILTEEGLAVALESLAQRAPLPVAVTADIEHRLAQAVEVAAYFLCSEAIANAAKHARASRMTVEASIATGTLTVTISDDGVGGADLDAGSGLRGLMDRVEAVGGSLSVHSPHGGGTRLTAVLPAAEPRVCADAGTPTGP